jgi:hypothetical protein
MNMWQKLFSLYALTEVPDEHTLFRNVITNWNCMEKKLDAAIPYLPKENYVLVHYENITSQPYEEMERIYTKLRLGDFVTAWPQIEGYLASRTTFQKNRYELDPGKAKDVYLSWMSIFEKYGYPAPIFPA